MKSKKLLAFVATVVSPAILAMVVVFPDIAWVLVAVSASVAIAIFGPVQVLLLLLAAGILGAIGESGQLGNLLAF